MSYFTPTAWPKRADALENELAAYVDQRIPQASLTGLVAVSDGAGDLQWVAATTVEASVPDGSLAIGKLNFVPALDADLDAHTALTTAAHGGIVAASDARLTDTRAPTAGSVTLASLDPTLKPSGTATASSEAVRALGATASTAAAGNDSRLPTAGQKNALAGTSGTPGTGNEFVTTADVRLSDQRVPTDLSVTAAKVAAALKPSGSAGATVEALRALGATSSTAAAGDDSRIPTQSENDALVGTSGTPGTANKFVTDADARVPTQAENDALQGTGAPSDTNRYVTADNVALTNSRSPTGTASGDLGGTYPSPTVAKLSAQSTRFGLGGALESSLGVEHASLVSNITPATDLHIDYTKAAWSVRQGYLDGVTWLRSPSRATAGTTSAFVPVASLSGVGIFQSPKLNADSFVQANRPGDVAGANTVALGYNGISTAVGPAISFGSAFDTNLYRAAGPVLKTDNLFNAGGGLQANGVNAILDNDARVPYRGSGSPEGVTTAPVGSLYERTDGTPGRVLYIKVTGAGNTGWVAVEEATGELARVELTSGTYTATSGTPADVGPLSITFTAPSRPVMLEAFMPYFVQATAAGNPSITITDTANVSVATGMGNNVAIGGTSGSVTARVPLATLTAGTSYTYKIRIQTTGSGGVCQLIIGTALKAFLRAVTI